MSSIFSQFVQEETSKTEDKKPSLFDRKKEAFSKDSSITSLSDALFGKDQSSEKVLEISMDSIVVGPQVRTEFVTEEIEELALSIKEHGLLQPVTVHKLDGSRYYLICGEKRYRATKLNGSQTIKAFVISQPKNQDEMLALQIIENMHRSAPPVFNIAAALSKLKESHSVEDLCKTLSCKKTYIYTMVSVDKSTNDEEKEFFKDMTVTFLQRYLDLKKKAAVVCRKTFAAMKEKVEAIKGTDADTKENRQRIIVKLLNKGIVLFKQQEKSKKLKELGKNSDDFYENLTFGKNISISWKKIDKIQPKTSMLLEQYLGEHPQVKPVDVIAKALASYLAKEDQDIYDSIEDSPTAEGTDRGDF